MNNLAIAPGRQISLLLVDDHEVVRKGLRSLLGFEEGLMIVGEARNGREAVVLSERLKPDVILMDIAMPMLNGLEATKQIRAADPRAKVLILSEHVDDGCVDRAISAGVVGFIEKQASFSVVSQGIRQVAKGGQFLSAGIAQRLTNARNRAQIQGEAAGARRPHLTHRESEVLQRVAEGWTNKQMAADFGISIKTVEKHRQKVMDKLDIHEIASLTRFAIAEGVIENPVQLEILPSKPRRPDRRKEIRMNPNPPASGLGPTEYSSDARVAEAAGWRQAVLNYCNQTTTRPPSPS
jgi:DNA-binding NarL/FixJ family response regulator